jgi:hypothetical protein
MSDIAFFLRVLGAAQADLAHHFAALGVSHEIKAIPHRHNGVQADFI